MLTVSGITYYRFSKSTWITTDNGTVAPMANAPVTLYADDDAVTPLSVLDLTGQPWTPVTNSQGLLPGFYAPQYDDVSGNAGSGRQDIRSSELAAVIAGLVGTAAQSALDILQPQIDALQATIDSLGTLPDSEALQDLTDGLQALQAEVTDLPHRNADGVLDLVDLGIFRTDTTDADVPGAKAEALAESPGSHTLFIPDV